ncbi:transposase [Streptomyces sp. NPDC059161]|uniref:transposase n=1 Tax=Streptomyces sp. NPDC059161 TaxID=3346749 RepID=UPI0036B3CAD6
MLDAIRYVTDNGIKWRALPLDFPAWDRVYAYFRRWRDQGLAKEFHDRLRGRLPDAEGRDAQPTTAIIDSQSVKATASVPAATRGFHGGKKINGRRRHIITDTLGLLLMVLVTAGNVTDRQTARVLLPQLHARRHRVLRLVRIGDRCMRRSRRSGQSLGEFRPGRSPDAPTPPPPPQVRQEPVPPPPEPPRPAPGQPPPAPPAIPSLTSPGTSASPGLDRTSEPRTPHPAPRTPHPRHRTIPEQRKLNHHIRYDNSF